MDPTLPSRPPYEAVLFDLLTALLDSRSLWNAVAGSDTAGARWRAEYLKITYGTRAYVPYDELVARAAEAVGLPQALAVELDRRYCELEPWPGVEVVLRTLSVHAVPLGIVTNCSERLGQIAVERLGIQLATVVTAERAGWYKPDARPYELALRSLGVAPARCLFVAGSPYDLVGTAKVGMPAFWHNRTGVERPHTIPAPLYHERSLDALPALLDIPKSASDPTA